MTVKAKPRKHLSARTSKSGPREARFWVAAGALALYGAGCGTQKAHALPAPHSVRGVLMHASASANTLPVRRFDIAPGELKIVSDAYQKATGISLTFADQSLGGVQSPGVSGLYNDEQALAKILEGTNVVYRFTGSSQAMLRLREQKSTVDVSETLPAIGSVSKYTEPILTTPQTISVVPEEIIRDQGATTLRDTLRNFAGISLAAGEGGAQGDNLTIRGFSARNDIFLDGMRDFGSYYRDPFNTEEVAVLQGPSSVTFGRGSTGGIVNQQTKTARPGTFFSGTLQLGTDLTRRVTADVNRPLTLFGKTAEARLNVMGNENNVAGRDITENRRFGVAPSLAFGLGTPTRVIFNYFHQTASDQPDYGLPWLFNQPAPVNRKNYYGFKDSDFLRTYADVGTAKVEHDFNSAVTLRNQFRYANYNRAVQITEPQIASPSLALPLSSLMVNRREIAARSSETALDDQLDLTAHVNTGAIRHTIVSGFEVTRETSDPTRYNYTNLRATSLLQPNTSNAFTGIPTVSTRVNTTAVSVAGYVLDDIKFGRHWELTGGFRFDRFNADYKQNIAPVAAFSRVDHLPSWRGALVYKPNGKGSIYVSSGVSFNPSAESLSLSSNTANLPPEKNLSYEAGTKWDLLSSKLSLRTAVFRTEKTNAREPDPNNPAFNVLAGKQRVDGVEWQATGRITDRWQLMTGYAYLKGRVTASQYYPQAIGAQLANVPANSFNFWSSYNFAWRHISLGAGGQFIDSRTASSTVPFDPTTRLVKQAPSYWVFNAMGRYPITERMSLQANVYNVANRFYYDQLHPSHIVPGPGRSALIGINYIF